ncbi:MAG: diaminopimelate decarboxylase [Burkholderiaceae bacterium]
MPVDAFQYREHRLHAEDLALADIAERFGTPTWVYSRAAIEAAFDEFAQAAAGRRVLVCYALKANSNLAIIDLLARRGAGFDIVSGGELERVLAAGGDPGRVVFSGVGKTRAEMHRALEVGVRCFNVESESELRRLDAVAGTLGRRAPVSLRVNPDVDPGTHPYISTGLRESKFGIAHDQALRVYRLAAALPNIALAGVDCHIGSQITSIAPFLAALDKMLELIDTLAAEGIALSHLDLGGGLGIRYDDETPPTRTALLQAIFERLDRHPGGRELELQFEFGRSIVGNAGLLLTRVEYLKDNGDRRFAIIDAAMNDLMRPALYEAWHGVQAVDTRLPRETATWEIVGPVCESGDWLARARPLAIAEGDLLALMSAGAYGMTMSSNYNTRPRGAEVLVDGGTAHLIRERERVEDLYALERRLPQDE